MNESEIASKMIAFIEERATASSEQTLGGSIQKRCSEGDFG